MLRILLILLMSIMGPICSAQSGQTRLVYKHPLRVLEELIKSRSGQKGFSNGQAIYTTNLEQRIASHEYQLQVRLLLAEVEAQLLGSKNAMKFFQQATTLGLPGLENLNFCDNYILSFDTRLNHPIWVLEFFDHGRRVPNTRLLPLLSETDYVIDIFHQHPDSMAKQTFTYQTCCIHDIVPKFVMTNPDLGRRLEQYATHLAKHSRNILVITGSMYKAISTVQYLGIVPNDDDFEKVLYTTINTKGMAIPTHFYKILVYEKPSTELAMEAFLIPNNDRTPPHLSLVRCRVDIDKELPEIEKEVGLKFFEILNRTRVSKPSELQYQYSEA